MKIDAGVDPPIAGKVPHRSWDRAIAELARAQHGVVGRRQLLGLGMTRHEIDGRMSRSLLHELHRGVYVVGYRRISRKGRWLAAVIACGPDAVLSHRAAGALWGVLPRGALHLDVTVPRGQRSRRPQIASHEAWLLSDEVDEIEGIPTTSIFRTMLDLASMLDLRRLERAWNEMEVRELRDRTSMPDLLARHPGRRGIMKLRTLLATEAPEGITRNHFEEAFVALLNRYGLPRGRMNADLAVRGRFFEIDCLWERERLAVELDGGGVHRTRKAFQHDRLRDRILTAEGWRTSRITWDQLRDEPAEIAADLRRTLSGHPNPSVPPGHHPHPPDK